MKKNYIRALAGGTGAAILAGLCLFHMDISTEDASKKKKDTVMQVSGRAGIAAEEINFGSEFERKRFALTAKSREAVFEPAGEASQESAQVPEPAEELVQPVPEPNDSVVVAAQEPEPEPAEEPPSVPVVASVDAPGEGEITEIAPEIVETPKPVFDQAVQIASIQGGCSIMGQTYTYLEQMVRYYNANQSYPAFYAGTEAPTIEAFCQIYMEEAQAEGVRTEVAFCQAMKETGFLRYMGDVQIDQYNFAGIGATGGVPGYSFAGVRAGIRAQIQHLKAYASNDGLNSQCVDPRFGYVKRGTAPLVEWLGIHENPYGGGWAAALNYGPSIVNDYLMKLFSY